MQAVAWLLCGSLAFGPAASERAIEGPNAVAWPEGAEPEDAEPADAEPTDAEPDDPAAVSPPPPQAARPDARKIRVAVGLDPSAPGTREERDLLSTLFGAVKASEGVRVDPRRLRVGAPSSREVCRDGRDDLVVMVGYVPQRPEPVLLPYDCVLDVALAVRSTEAADEPGLVSTLWDEHEALVRDGVQERRRSGRLGPKARAGIVAGVVVLVVGAAVGLLVANALREEKVVLKVGP